MGAVENLAVHLRWAEADDRHDLSHHHEFVHEDIVVHHLDGETIVGLGALVANMEASLEAMPDYTVTIDDRFATDDRVVCRWRVSGTPRGGPPIEVAGISVWEFDEGKARRGWVCTNAAALAQRGVADAHAYSLQAHEPGATS
jgi:hypothetical protein